MNIDRWIGTTPVRVAAMVFAALSVCAFITLSLGVEPAGLLKIAGIAFALVALMGLIASSQTAYHRWMAFAAVLQKVVVTFLFGACYVLLVPFFWLLIRNSDPLKLRAPDANASLWLARKPDDTSADSYLRMG